jgi:hypothetical protein
MVDERAAKSKSWPDSPKALPGRLRRAATFLRRIGVEIGFDREGKALKPVPLNPVSSVGQVVRLKGDEILYRSESYMRPPAWYRYAGGTGKVTPTALARTSPAKFEAVEVVRACPAVQMPGVSMEIREMAGRTM